MVPSQCTREAIRLNSLAIRYNVLARDFIRDRKTVAVGAQLPTDCVGPTVRYRKFTKGTTNHVHILHLQVNANTLSMCATPRFPSAT